MAANHRAWFRRCARVARGEVERFGSLDLTIRDGTGTIAFPGSRTGIDDALGRIRSLGLREAGCWSLHSDPALGTALVARGFAWGWQPHWMALAVGDAPDPPPAHEAVRVRGPYPDGLPYATTEPDPPQAVHLGVRRGGRTAGHVVVHPWHGVAGIYSMGVIKTERRQGIGVALIAAACRTAEELGCTDLVLNATPDGERVYRRAGFRSLGHGQTWWWSPGPAPTPRQRMLAEAIGSGDLAALDALDPGRTELEEPLPGGTSPLRLALLTGRSDSAGWLLDREPELAHGRFEPFGGTLLHLAVEWNDQEFLRLALARGVDPAGRDATYRSTALQWACQLGRGGMAAELRRRR